jgi:hypothetical protein
MDITSKEIKMNLKKVFFIKLLVLLIAFSFIGPAFSQGRGGKRIVYAGVIDWVSQDFKSIAINKVEHRIAIAPQTKVLDEWGNTLKASDLRKGLSVVVESVRNPDGSTEKRIIIRSERGAIK